MPLPPKPYLPGILRLIADEVSEDTAIKLAKARGGRYISIPKTVTSKSVLADILGLDDARAVAKVLGHGVVKVPSGSLRGVTKRRARVQALYSEGLSNAEIAAEVDVDIRTVERIVRALRQHNQPELPF